MNPVPPQQISENIQNAKIIDSHCHLDFSAFQQDRQKVLEQCWKQGVTNIVIPGVLASQWDSLQSLCEHTNARYPIKLHFALGLHPVFIKHHTDEHIQQLDQRLANNAQDIVAVGEIGLDFFEQECKQESQQRKQLDLFEQQLQLAKKYDLPVILHTRKSHDQTLALLKQHCVKGGIAHAFNGSIQQAYKFIELGFKLGFGGMLTYERSRKLRQLAKELPLESIVLETDSPDMTVEQHKGQRNSPEFLPFVLNALADLRAESMEHIAAVTSANSKAVLNLP